MFTSDSLSYGSTSEKSKSEFKILTSGINLNGINLFLLKLTLVEPTFCQQ